MALLPMQPLLRHAQQEGYAVGSFSVANMEMVLGILRAAEETNSPVILQIAQVRLPFSPLALIGPLMVGAARAARVPVAVHLDHGQTLAVLQQALDIGFSSVMLDGSHLPLEENILLTQQARQLAQTYHASLEAEIGAVGGSEDGSEDIAMRCTDPQEAARFYSETGVDALAVAIGNAHGQYKQAPRLQLALLEEIRQAVSAPLVLHGGTGISPVDFRACIAHGVHKINIATATFDAVQQGVRKAYGQNAINGYYDLHTAEVNAAYQNALQYISIFGCENRAPAVQ